MHLKHFSYLLEINKQHSISAAARSLYMGQTTLSSIVKSVEEELGFPIFQRAPSGVVPTDKGERLIALAWEIAVKYEELQTLKERQMNAALPIMVPVSPGINVGVSIPLMERFYANDTHSTLIFEECPRLDICNQIIKNKVNIGITCLRQEEIQSLLRYAEKNNVIIKPLIEDRFFLVVKKEHVLANRTQVDLKELHDERLAIATPLREEAENKMLESFNRCCSRITSYPTIHIIKDAILKQNMVSILTGLAIYYDTSCLSDNFDIVELSKLDLFDVLQVCVIYRESKNLRYSERILLRCIEDYFSTITFPEIKAKPV